MLINASILLPGSKKEAEVLFQPRCDRKRSGPARPSPAACAEGAGLRACSAPRRDALTKRHTERHELQHGSEGIKGRYI